MIEVIPALSAVKLLLEIAEKLRKLFGITRVGRRELLLDMIEPIYEDLEKIHKDYISSLTDARARCIKDPKDIQGIVRELEMARIELEPSRESIIATCDKLLSRKWREEVRKFLQSTKAYFVQDDNFAIIVHNISGSTEELMQRIEGYTAYSRIIAILSYIVSLHGLKPTNRFFPVPLIGADSGAEIVRNEVALIFDETLGSIRERWRAVSGDFAELRARNQR